METSLTLPPGVALKVPVCRRENYVIFLECYQGQLVGHMDVLKWGPETLRAIQRDVDAIMSLTGAPVSLLHDPADAKHLKFCRAIGFHPAYETTGHGGRRWIVLQRSN